MNLYLSLYNYVNIAVVGVLFALEMVLMLRHVRRGDEMARYRRSRNCLLGVFALIGADLIFSLVANNLPVSDFVDTVIDVLFYTPVAILFAWMCSWLVDENSDYRLKIVRDVMIWILTLVGLVVAINLPDAQVSKYLLWGILIFWFFFICSFARRIFICFKKARKRIENFYSDDVVVGLNSLSRGVLTFVTFGMASPFFAVMSPEINTFYLVWGCVVYIILCATLLNYYDSFEMIDRVIHPKESFDAETLSKDEMTQVRWLMKGWEEKLNFRKRGITINDLAADIKRKVPEVAAVIEASDDKSFHAYIDRLRVCDAQTLLVHYPNESMAMIADRVGYRNEEELTIYFKKVTNVTPSDWRSGVLKLME